MLIIFSLFFYNALSWCLRYTLTETSNSISAVDYSPDGSMIALGGMSDGFARIYDAQTYDLKLSIPNTTNTQVSAVKFSKNNQYLAVGYRTGLLKVINLANGSTMGSGVYSTGQGMLYALDFNSDSSILASCGNNPPLKLLSTNTWSISNGVNSGNPFTWCEFTFDNKLLVASKDDGRVYTFNSPYTNSSNQMTFNNGGSNGGLTCLAYKW